MSTEDIIFLMASHIAIVDGEIDMREIQTLNENFNVSDNIKEEQANIFSGEPKIRLEDLIDKAKKFRISEKEGLFKILLIIAYADAHYHSKEIEKINDIAKKLDFPQEILKKIEEEIRKEVKVYIEKKRSVLEVISSILYKVTKSEVFENRLLSGKEFVDRIKSISSKAVEDLNFASFYMEEVNDVLSSNYRKLGNYINQIKKHQRNDDSSKELTTFVETLDKKIELIISERLRENREILDKKKRTIEYFTIAFMGRTKAGKSTFHKVITGVEVDDIGVGKLRTTRFNRVFNWENIRIVDTPGIGAPGGQSDTETAKTIIDEADLVCYVVTNDSIQETEFDFLKGLKEKNKPLFIILNIKENLENTTRLKRFIENPLKWKEESGHKSIQGHFERIKDCIGRNYDINSIEIIPIQLLAALFSEDTKKEFSSNEREQLHKGSNVSEYIQKVKQTIFKTGHLKKTQNIIEGCNYQVYFIEDEMKQALYDLKLIRESLINSQKTLNDFLDKGKREVEKNLKKSIGNTFETIKNSVRGFAENNCEASQSQLGELWNKHMKDNVFYEKLGAEVTAQFSDLERKIKEKIEECMEDFQMLMNLQQTSSNMSIQTHDTTDYRFLVSITVASIGVVLGIGAILNIWNPVGWVGVALLLANGLAYGLEYLFDSKEKKIQKAKKKIEESIIPNVEKNRVEYEKEVLKGLNDFIKKTHKELNNNFNALIGGADQVIEVLSIIDRECSQKAKKFNVILFYRMLEHLKLERKKLTIDKINELITITDIERNFKKSTMIIKSKYPITDSQEQEISNLLQTKIKFNKL